MVASKYAKKYINKYNTTNWTEFYFGFIVRDRRSIFITLRASCGAVYCNRSCLFVCSGRAACVYVCVCLWVCYHDNSKLRASILTELGL